MEAVSETLFEPGDRVELLAIPGAEGHASFAVPDTLAASRPVINQIENEQGLPLAIEYDSQRAQLHVSGWPDGSAERCGAAWLEYRGPGQFRLVAEPMPQDAAELHTEQGISIVLDPGNWPLIRDRATHLASLEESALALRAARLATHAGFDRLICLPLVRDMELLEHQIRTAKTVLRRFRGRAMLCDEVGLGKTIEAGLVVDELHTRGLARSDSCAGAAVPDRAMARRDAPQIRPGIHQPRRSRLPRAGARTPGPHSTASSFPCTPPNASRTARPSSPENGTWSSLTRPTTCATAIPSSGASPASCRSNSSLLLTATPVQNNLDELFNLVTLLEPGLLSTAKKFQKPFRRP